MNEDQGPLLEKQCIICRYDVIMQCNNYTYSLCKTVRCCRIMKLRVRVDEIKLSELGSC